MRPLSERPLSSMIGQRPLFFGNEDSNKVGYSDDNVMFVDAKATPFCFGIDDNKVGPADDDAMYIDERATVDV